MTVEHKDIHEAINAVMQEVGYVQKKKSGDLKYTYAGEASLIEAIRPAMVEHGIYMHVLEVKKLYRSTYETKHGTAMFNTLTEGIVRFTHVSGSYIDCQATGEGSDTGDKSANKAMTGLYKYAMRQTFCIETGDDPDGFSSEAMERKSVSKPARAAAQVSTGVKVAATMPLDDHQKGANAPDSQKSGNGASEQPGASGSELAQELATAEYTGNQILGSKDGVLVKEIMELSGKGSPEVCGYVSKLEKGKKFSIGQIVKALTEEKS
jgi:hypothetical protein